MDYVTPIRISPSGPVVGSPPVLVGGATQDGRVWRYRGDGSGGVINLPGDGPSNPIPGLSALTVDLKSGYNYDLEVDVWAQGAGRQQLRKDTQLPMKVGPGIPSYLIGVLFSRATPGTGGVSQLQYTFDVVASGRLHALLSGYTDDDYTQMLVWVQRMTGTPGSDLIYNPGQCVVNLTEYSAA